MANKSEFALTWSEFNSSISSGFHDSLIRGDLVDVTLAAEGQLIKAHRLVLSVCSPYFRRMLTTMPENQHAFIFLMDVKHSMLKDLITFMYCGEVNVKMESLTSFMSLAQQLEIKGLTSRSIQKVPKKIPTATTTTATTLPPLIKCAAVPQESYNQTESKPLQNIQPMKQPAPVSQPTSFYTVKNETGNNPSEFEEYAISIKSEPEDYDENAMSISMDNNPIQIHPGPVEEPVENNNYSLYNTYGQGTSSTNRVVYTSQMQERDITTYNKITPQPTANKDITTNISIFEPDISILPIVQKPNPSAEKETEFVPKSMSDVLKLDEDFNDNLKNRKNSALISHLQLGANVVNCAISISSDGSSDTPSSQCSRMKQRGRPRKPFKEHMDIADLINKSPATISYYMKRFRNNEASRKSRFNRIMQKIDLNHQCERLNVDNYLLKQRRTKLQHLLDECVKVIKSAY